MFTGPHVKCPFFCQTLIKLEYPQQIFEKYLDIKFHENPSSGSRFVPCGRIDLTQIVVAFLSDANLPIMIFLCSCFSVFCSAETRNLRPKFSSIYSRCGNSFGRGFQCSANPRSKVFSLHYSLKR
jgi:hypothetical protein